MTELKILFLVHAVSVELKIAEKGLTNLCHTNLLVMDTEQSITRDEILSASMMASDTHSIHPVAPVSQSVISPGAHFRCLAKGPNTPYPVLGIKTQVVPHAFNFEAGPASYQSGLCDCKTESFSTSVRQIATDV